MEQLQDVCDEFNFDFALDDSVYVNDKELFMINHELGDNCVSCQISSYNGMRVVSYDISATLTMRQFFKKQIYKSEILKILSSILSKLIVFEEKDMPLKKVLLNLNYMYIDLADLKVQLIYLPIVKDFKECNMQEFFLDFISNVRFANMKCVLCVDQIVKYLEDNIELSVREFYEFINKLKKESLITDTKEIDSHIPVLQDVKYNTLLPYLVRIRTNEIIPIEKAEFLVGKSTNCDYQVVDNRRISRNHCTIKLNNGEYYLRDNNSTNHTYINGELVLPGADIMLNNDDYIRMADEEFKYWLR